MACPRPVTAFVEIVPAHYDGGMSMLPAEDYLAGPANLAVVLGLSATIACMPGGLGALAFAGPRVLDGAARIVVLAGWPAYLRFLWRQRDAVVYANFRTASSLLAALLARRSVLVAHATLPRSRVKRLLLALLLRRFTVIRALTEHERRELCALGLGRRVALVPLAVDGRFFATPEPAVALAALRAELGLGTDRVLLCVANVRRVKRLDTVLRALARLLHAGAAVRLVVAGEDRLHDEGLPSIREMASALGVVERVVATGFVAPAAVRRLLQLADVFVNSSQDEAQCLAACEAAAAARPLCLADVPSLRLAFPNALFHWPDDDATLAANVTTVLEGGYSELALRAEQRRVQQRCDPQQVNVALAALLLGADDPRMARVARD